VLRSTALVGFPGEEEEDVEQLLDFLAEVRFDHLGTYRFSPERGTPAALLADRPADEEVADREARVLDLQSGISGARMADRLGESFEIVIDELLAPGAPDSRERASELGGALLDGVWRTPADRAQAAALIAAGPRLALGRSLHFGYDLDGVVVLPATGDLGPGEWCTGRFTGATPWDVWAERVQ